MAAVMRSASRFRRQHGFHRMRIIIRPSTAPLDWGGYHHMGGSLDVFDSEPLEPKDACELSTIVRRDPLACTPADVYRSA